MDNSDNILSHVFLPLKLPDGSTAEEVILEDARLLGGFCEFLSMKYCKECPFPRTLQAFRDWQKIQDSQDEALLSQALSELGAGHSLPVYVRAQNAGLLVTLSDACCDGHPAGSPVVSTFAASEKASDVSSAAGDLMTSYPLKWVHAPRSELLTSHALARQVISLKQNVMSEAMTKTMKSNQCYDDERDVADPMFVSKWLCGSLCNERSCLCTEAPRIVKKVRDEVVFGSNRLPFRRSGIWTVVKVVLQLLLAMELGSAVGRQMYKAILLHYMCMLSTLCNTADMGTQVMAKIARRLYKLDSPGGAQDPAGQELLEKLRKDVEAAVERLQKRLDAEWKTKIEEHEGKTRLQLSGSFDFFRDSEHVLAPLVKYLKSRTASKMDSLKNADGQAGKVPTPASGQMLRKLSAAPFDEFVEFCAQGVEALRNLFCFEHQVLRNLILEQPVADYAVVGKAFLSYLRSAETAYQGDQVGISRAVLVCLRILQWVDKSLCKSYSLMKDHKTDVPTQIIEHLMLPFCSELKVAHDIETYFMERRLGSCYPSLLAPYERPLASLYSVRHAEKDSGMQQKRREILAEGERLAEVKMAEARRERRTWDELESRIKRMRCECTYYIELRIKCKRCCLKGEADGMRVKIYEKPLPPEAELQNAIVFDLSIPAPIFYFLEMLRAFHVHLGVLPLGESCNAMWPSELHRYASALSGSLTVSIGSRHGPQTRYYPRELHPQESESKFVVENSGDVQLCVNGQTSLPVRDIPNEVLRRFVFKVEPGSPYASLQWALDDHTYAFSDNQVIARQHECPTNLSLTEFKEFGAVRAGHRIQLRNLYRAMKQGTLSMNKESVLNLVYEVLWRAGPPSDDRSLPAHIRQAHVDLLNKGFLTEFLQLLGTMISGFSKSWDDHHTYAAIVAILLRVSSVTKDDEILQACSAYLRECRKILRDWRRSIEKAVDTMGSEAVDKQQEMRKKLVAVAVLCCCTYWSDVELTVRENVEHVLPWLMSITTIQEYLGKEGSGSSTFLNQLRRFRECSYASLRGFRKLVKLDPAVLQAFTQDAWSGFSGQDVHWVCCEGDGRWFAAEVAVGGCTTVLHLDLLEGHFLVNGKPQDYLPSDLKNHLDYMRVFGDFVVKVQPRTQSPWSAVSKHLFRGEKMLFVENRNSPANPYIISAVDVFSQEREYVPEGFLGTASASGESMACMQQFLIREHTHWWNASKRCIEFRSKTKHDPKFLLDLDSGLIEEDVTGRFAIDSVSPTFARLMTVFTRLEQEQFVEVFRCAGEPEGLDVQLPRMRLHFKVMREGSCLHVSSLEYPGMEVAEVQQCGTLVGINSGLLLRPTKEGFSNKLLLIPHGQVSLPDANGGVMISTASLRSPPYFAYEVDQTLWQLKSGQTKSATAYLAYLHALTSHPLPDPLTGHTGTERALQLLQSGHCWSCEPFDGETAKTLSLVAQLSPKRKYSSKTKAMTSASWPLPSSIACNDAFQMVVAKLSSDSQRLSALFGSSLSVTLDSKNELILCNKAYWRYFKCTTEQAHISPEFLAMHPPRTAVSVRFKYDFNGQNMKVVLELVSLVDSWSIASYSSWNLYPSLVCGRSVLQGHGHPFPVMATIAHWKNLEFWNSWISLYSLAKQVRSINRELEWKMILTSYAFAGIPNVQLVLLHTIAVYPEYFEFDPPSYSAYVDPHENTFLSSKVRDVIACHVAVSYRSFLKKQGYSSETISKKSNDAMLKSYDQRLNSQIDGLVRELQGKAWPFRTCRDVVDYLYYHDNLLDLEQVKKSVDMLLNRWADNFELQQFINRVETQVVQLSNSLQTVGPDASDVCQKLSLEENVTVYDGTSKPVEFGIQHVRANGEEPSECGEAVGVFQRGEIADPSCLASLNAYVIANRKENAANNNYHDILSDPEKNNRKCNIWEQLVTCLKTEGLSKVSKRREGLHPMTTRKRVRAITSPVSNMSSSSNTCIKSASQEESAAKKKCRRLTSLKIENLSNVLKHQEEKCAEAQMKYWALAQSMIMSDPMVKILATAGIFQRLTPLTLLPVICHWESNLSRFQNCLRNVLGAFAVAVTSRKHASRCLKYFESNCQFELDRELADAPHQNWSPAERPKWLLFEIEMDLLVRPVQKQVAELLENPEDGRNAVTQLNMGEGKTAVITPMLVLSLANEKQLCRVTVLRSLFNTNKQALNLNLGGLLLNRRVYSFPCRRDFPVNAGLVRALFDVYQECADKGGVSITTPEYRLSFQLKTYEQCRAGQHEVAKLLIQVQDWLKANARDILDESDEILHVKYQLVYTLGVQMPPVGGSQRWTVLQRLLKEIPEVVKILAETSDPGCVEILEDASESASFPRCRLLKFEEYERFCDLLVQRILSGTEFPNLDAQNKELLRIFLTKEIIDTDLIKKVFEFLPSNLGAAFHEKALILRGLIACGVLFSTLSKRWRVNYGVSPNGSTPLAVPFRAKDVAAERTEFGHPDVALVLTHLSYYYSGLSESQVSDCLFRVMQGPNPDMEYAGWISAVKDPDPSVVSLRGVNLDDHVQRRDKLFPTLKKNKAVVDYWLGNIVLPVKFKQFPLTISSTAWDLASDRALKATTGFSGTNDTQILLPATIAQKDLPELRLTNYKVFQTLLLEENNSYKSLPPGEMSLDILEKLVASGIPLLLDVGALMLDLDNKAVAEEWLKLVSKGCKKAAVYFSAEDRLMVKDRSSLDPVPFEISPFRSMLDQCVIYLDDVHTRGTDLKLPAGIKGCITLGKGVTKDKLVQGCMRLRKLGKGHTVCFWASDEVNNEIREMTDPGCKLGSAQVLKWALNNSRNAMRDGFVHWVMAARNFLRKTDAHARYDATSKADGDRVGLAEEVSVAEVTELMEMYGTPWSTSSFPEFAARLLQGCGSEVLDSYRNNMIERCHYYVPDLKKFVHLLDEEQERELELELEEERELERPGAANPCKPVLDGAMVRFLQAKSKVLDCWNLPAWAVRLPEGLRFTRLAKHNETSAWGDCIYVTTDFLRTVESQHPQDSYLRTVNWIAAFVAGGSWHWLLLSPFEVNSLLPLFRNQQLGASLHMYAARLTMTQSTLLELGKLVLPVGATPSLMSTADFSGLNASLSIFAGCTFFQDEKELESFCAITGYVPNPRSPEVEQALPQMVMDNAGFLLPLGRQQLRPKCRFQRNPERLIVGIILCRYNYFSRLCHVSRLVHECRKPKFD